MCNGSGITKDGHGCGGLQKLPPPQTQGWGVVMSYPLTPTQESVARSWYDPDCVLTTDELAETAQDAIKCAATELRSRARYLDSFYRKPGEPYGQAIDYIVNHLRARADELDGGS